VNLLKSIKLHSFLSEKLIYRLLDRFDGAACVYGMAEILGPLDVYIEVFYHKII